MQWSLSSNPGSKAWSRIIPVSLHGSNHKPWLSASLVDGLRIDSALNVDPAFFDEFVPASGVFATGESMNGITFTACKYQRAIGSVLNYPV
jgi:hypothetical protein